MPREENKELLIRPRSAFIYSAKLEINCGVVTLLAVLGPQLVPVFHPANPLFPPLGSDAGKLPRHTVPLRRLWRRSPRKPTNRESGSGSRASSHRSENSGSAGA